MNPTKAAYMITDLKRLRKYYDIPLVFPQVCKRARIVVYWNDYLMLHYDDPSVCFLSLSLPSLHSSLPPFLLPLSLPPPPCPLCRIWPV